MPPSPQCTALANAQSSTGKSYAKIALEIGTSEQHVIDICTGATSPTQQEFGAIAQCLGISSSAPNTQAHATK